MEEKLKTWEDLRIEAELCYRLDMELYIPVKANPNILGFKKELYKRIIEEQMRLLRKELGIKWINHYQGLVDKKQLTKHEFIGIRGVLMHIFNITEEELKE